MRDAIVTFQESPGRRRASRVAPGGRRLNGKTTATIHNWGETAMSAGMASFLAGLVGQVLQLPPGVGHLTLEGRQCLLAVDQLFQRRPRLPVPPLDDLADDILRVG